jgi:hypothetical protein
MNRGQALETNLEKATGGLRATSFLLRRRGLDTAIAYRRSLSQQ